MPNTFKSAITSNLPITATNIYAAPTSSGAVATVIGCSFANTSNAPITVSLTINRPPSTVGYIVRQSTVPVGGTLVAIGAEQKVILQASDTLQGIASVANACDTLVSVLEIT